jgi:PTS system ascorbate-specific IIA component
MSDLFGATPTNIAAQAVRSGAVEVLTGVNLPMVLRALSYRPNASLEVVLEKASAGGTAGVMKIASTAPQNQRVPGVAGSQGTTTDGETGLEYAHATMHHQQ